MNCRRNKAIHIEPLSKCRRLMLWLADRGKAAISSGPHPHNSPVEAPIVLGLVVIFETK
jgi:hypothetical protein